MRRRACPLRVTPKLFEHLVHLRVALQIQPGEQHAVLSEEIADSKRVLRIVRADHAQASEVFRLAQHLPAGDERLEDDVAEFRVTVDQSRKTSGRQLVDFAIAPGDGADERGSAGQLRYVAGEFAGRRGRSTVFGVSPDSSLISMRPDLMTKNLKSRSPTSKSFSPAL